MPYDPLQPYNDLPPLPPSADVETKSVLKACAAAREQLAVLRTAGTLLPDDHIVLNTLPLREAQASSEIENIFTAQDRLHRAMESSQRDIDPHTKETLRYREALMRGYDMMKTRPLSTVLLTEVCSVLLDREIDVRKIPGAVIENKVTGKTIYTPPVGEDVIRDKLSDLERFIHAEDSLDPLVRLALLHYQFEAIHPFPDGNGRTGRILCMLYLIEKGLLASPILYLGGFIIGTKPIYYKLLRDVTEKGEWGFWVRYMVIGVGHTAGWTHALIQAIRELFDTVSERCRRELPGVYSHELIEQLFIHPYTKIRHLEAAGIAKRQTASTYLKRLRDIGILTELKVGRDKYFINTELRTLLETPYTPPKL